MPVFGADGRSGSKMHSSNVACLPCYIPRIDALPQSARAAPVRAPTAKTAGIVAEAVIGGGRSEYNSTFLGKQGGHPSATAPRDWRSPQASVGGSDLGATWPSARASSAVGETALVGTPRRGQRCTAVGGLVSGFALTPQRARTETSQGMKWAGRPNSSRCGGGALYFST